MEILPTSLAELPIQLRDLRNNQKPTKTNFLETIPIQRESLIVPYIQIFQLRGLRNNQKSSNTVFFEAIQIQQESFIVPYIPFFGTI